MRAPHGGILWTGERGLGWWPLFLQDIMGSEATNHVALRGSMPYILTGHSAFADAFLTARRALPFHPCSSSRLRSTRPTRAASCSSPACSHTRPLGAAGGFLCQAAQG